MPKKLPHNKQLQKECEQLWKEIIELRDGRECLVKKYFPMIKITHTGIYQADHCFTRGNKHLFLDPANGNMVCAACNMAKHYDNKSVKRVIDYITQQRVGRAKWKAMLECDMTMGPNVNWGKIWWLEERKETLTREKENLNQRTSESFVIDRQPKRQSKAREQWTQGVQMGDLFTDIEPI